MNENPLEIPVVPEKVKSVAKVELGLRNPFQNAVFKVLNDNHMLDLKNTDDMFRFGRKISQYIDTPDNEVRLLLEEWNKNDKNKDKFEKAVKIMLTIIAAELQKAA